MVMVGAASGQVELSAVPSAHAPVAAQAEFWVNFPTFSALNREFCRRAVTEVDQQFCTIADVNSAAFDSSPSDVELTLPSLWWIRDQLPRRLGRRRLVLSWAAYRLKPSSSQMVDVYLDSQIWNVLNAYEHYAVLNQFGRAAKEAGYQLRLFRGQGRGAQLMGLYLCEQDQAIAAATDQLPISSNVPCWGSIDQTVLDAYKLPPR
ncbi:hypothetical protein C7271_19275 [filamentous cyanobacterium CCP5]|nr:hypothetical protein C7271_19275 [filamentous cyanobacterium CCP5]